MNSNVIPLIMNRLFFSVGQFSHFYPAVVSEFRGGAVARRGDGGGKDDERLPEGGSIRLDSKISGGHHESHGVGSSAARIASAIHGDARLVADAGADAVEGAGYRHAGARRRLPGREASFPKLAAPLRDRKSLSAEGCEGRRKTSGSALRVRSFGKGRDGNKTAFQHHGIVVRDARLCLPDHRHVATGRDRRDSSMERNRYNRWWWPARGYTPAGIECWNGIRAIDYLQSRPEVDLERIAVTGISGGGAASFWIAAADERIKVAVPVSGMSDLEEYVGEKVVNGHCDCMF